MSNKQQSKNKTEFIDICGDRLEVRLYVRGGEDDSISFTSSYTSEDKDSGVSIELNLEDAIVLANFILSNLKEKE